MITPSAPTYAIVSPSSSGRSARLEPEVAAHRTSRLEKPIVRMPFSIPRVNRGSEDALHGDRRARCRRSFGVLLGQSEQVVPHHPEPPLEDLTGLIGKAPQERRNFPGSRLPVLEGERLRLRGLSGNREVTGGVKPDSLGLQQHERRDDDHDGGRDGDGDSDSLVVVHVSLPCFRDRRKKGPGGLGAPRVARLRPRRRSC